MPHSPEKGSPANASSSILSEYYAQYLKQVRAVKDSTVKHYLQALRTISSRLKTYGYIQNDIYEITDLAELNLACETLKNDLDFVALDIRGKNMYSSALKHYYNFANGKDFDKTKEQLLLLDVPHAAQAPNIEKHTIWNRSNILRIQAIEMAAHTCELNPTHESFIAVGTNKPYMEGHHALPMKQQPNFTVSLDVYANIVCQCPVCHRQIHYGLLQNRKAMLNQIYQLRVDRLANSGIKLSKDEFVEIATR